jgi:hypothetical protein
MLSHKSLVAYATLALLCSFSATNLAIAGAAADAQVESCATKGRAVVRYIGHPARPFNYPRRIKAASECAVAQESAPKAMMLASFLDAPGGKALVEGHTEKASRQIGDRVDSAREKTNLCVLRTLERNFADARGACDSAVEAAKRSRSFVKRWDRSKMRHANEVATVALSNRAVMNWLAGDTGAAYVDLANARAIDPKAEYVTRNFDVAVRVPAQVQLPVDPYLIG